VWMPLRERLNHYLQHWMLAVQVLPEWRLVEPAGRAPRAECRRRLLHMLQEEPGKAQ